MQVLVYSFRTLLALVHPIMPFVSERLWTILPAAKGAERQPLISAPWPSHSGAIDENAIAQYQARPLQTFLFRTSLVCLALNPYMDAALCS